LLIVKNILKHEKFFEFEHLSSSLDSNLDSSLNHTENYRSISLKWFHISSVKNNKWEDFVKRRRDHCELNAFSSAHKVFASFKEQLHITTISKQLWKWQTQHNKQMRCSQSTFNIPLSYALFKSFFSRSILISRLSLSSTKLSTSSTSSSITLLKSLKTVFSLSLPQNKRVAFKRSKHLKRHLITDQHIKNVTKKAVRREIRCSSSIEKSVYPCLIPNCKKGLDKAPFVGRRDNLTQHYKNTHFHDKHKNGGGKNDWVSVERAEELGLASKDPRNKEKYEG